MIEYDGSKCEPHGITRCVTCMGMTAKGRKPVSKAPTAPPSEIVGGPPPDIEGMGSVRDREEKTPEEINTEYDKILAEVNAMRLEPGAIIEVPQPGNVDPFRRDTFATLPVDDSHASKVLRAAAEFASAAQAWAQELAYVEKVRKILLTAEAQLGKVSAEKDKTEQVLKQLVTGEFQGNPHD